MNYRTSRRSALFARITMAILAVLAASAIVWFSPLTPITAYAATRISCVRASGGATAAPCRNKLAYRSIQEAIDQAVNIQDEIRIAAGTYTSPRAGYPVARIGFKSLTLKGGYANNDWVTPGAPSATIIDGQGTVRGVEVNGQVFVEIDNLTITNGNAVEFGSSVVSGGGVYANELRSEIVLVNTVITNNKASSDGGGVYTAGTLVIRSSRLAGNTSPFRGGGAYASFADVDGSTFENNIAGENGGGLSTVETIVSNTRFLGNQGSNGGGLDTLSRSTIIDTDFIGNHAVGNGGGLFQDFVEPARADIFGGIFRDNVAGGHGGGLIVDTTAVLTGTLVISNSAGLNGGGVFVSRTAGSLQTTDVLFDHNQAAGDGGGIWAAGPVSLRRTRISYNLADANGGGLFQNNGLDSSGRPRESNVLGCQIEQNQAKASGGGIYYHGSGALTLAATRVVRNSAAVDGGGMEVGAASSPTTEDLTLTGGNFEQNHADGAGGGLHAANRLAIRAAQIAGNTAGINGGGLTVGGESTQLIGVLLGDNRASAGGDALYANTVTFAEANLSLVNVTTTSATLAPHAAIEVRGNPTYITLTNTIVTSHTVGIARASNSTLAGGYDDLFGNTTEQIVGGVATPLTLGSALHVDPQFVAPAAHDFHLAPSSPLIGAADPNRNYTGQLDMDGQRVPAGGKPEIGADEVYTYRNFIALQRS